MWCDREKTFPTNFASFCSNTSLTPGSNSFHTSSSVCHEIYHRKITTDIIVRAVLEQRCVAWTRTQTCHAPIISKGVSWVWIRKEKQKREGKNIVLQSATGTTTPELQQKGGDFTFIDGGISTSLACFSSAVLFKKGVLETQWNLRYYLFIYQHILELLLVLSRDGQDLIQTLDRGFRSFGFSAPNLTCVII